MSAHVLGPAEVKRLLPQKPPFLMVDCVEAYERGARLVARKAVTLGEAYFAGHFPELPIMPGVLVVEGLAQAACALASLDALGWTVGTPLPVAAGGDDVVHVLGALRMSFARPVFPGSMLSLEVALVERRSAGSFFEASAAVAGEVVARGSLTVGAMPRARFER